MTCSNRSANTACTSVVARPVHADAPPNGGGRLVRNQRWSSWRAASCIRSRRSSLSGLCYAHGRKPFASCIREGLNARFFSGSREHRTSLLLTDKPREFARDELQVRWNFLRRQQRLQPRDYLLVVREQVADVLADDAVADFKATLRCPQECRSARRLRGWPLRPSPRPRDSH